MSEFASIDELADTILTLCSAGLLEAIEREDGELGFRVTDAGREAFAKEADA